MLLEWLKVFMFNDIFIAPAYPADITLSYHMEANDASQHVWILNIIRSNKMIHKIATVMQSSKINTKYQNAQSTKKQIPRSLFFPSECC